VEEVFSLASKELYLNQKKENSDQDGTPNATPEKVSKSKSDGNSSAEKVTLNGK
jgi:hypothetical protein